MNPNPYLMFELAAEHRRYLLVRAAQQRLIQVATTDRSARATTWSWRWFANPWRTVIPHGLKADQPTM